MSETDDKGQQPVMSVFSDVTDHQEDGSLVNTRKGISKEQTSSLSNVTFQIARQHSHVLANGNTFIVAVCVLTTSVLQYFVLNNSQEQVSL